MRIATYALSGVAFDNLGGTPTSSVQVTVREQSGDGLLGPWTSGDIGAVGRTEHHDVRGRKSGNSLSVCSDFATRVWYSRKQRGDS